MAFISTLDSLQRNLASSIDLSNYATKTELNSKANTSDLATIATSGSYNDLTNKPTLFSGDYTDLTNKPTIPDTSNFVTNTTLTTKLAKSLEKGITVTASNNTFTIDPNAGALFIVAVSSNSTIAISNLDSDFTSLDDDFTTGSVLTILMVSSDPSYTVSWPSTIIWKDGTAPDLSESEINLVTLTTFSESEGHLWVGGSVPIVIPDTGDS